METFISLVGLIFCILVLFNFKGFSQSVINIQREMWHGGKPLPSYIEKATRLVALVILAILLGLSLYDAITGFMQGQG